jgi:cytochrome P450
MSILELSIHDVNAREDPAGFFGKLRDEQPVAWIPSWNGWVVSGYDEVLLALRERELSSERLPSLPAGEDAARVLALIERWIVFMDPPDHTRLRGLVAKAFTPRAIGAVAATMPGTVSELLDAWTPGEPVDVIKTLAFPFPARVISTMLEVPAADIDRFGDLSDDVAELIHAGRQDPTVMIESFLELDGYLRQHIDAKRRNPTEGLISQLIAVEEEGDVLSTDELIATCVMLLFAGHETTKNLIGNTIYLLGEQPQIFEALRADSSRFGDAVEEFLRLEGPAKATIRNVGPAGAELAGQTLLAGQRLLLQFAAANRDPAVFDDPDRFRLDRGKNPHLGFGHGIHYCLGAAIVRAELRVVLAELCARFEAIEIAGAVQWQDRMLNRGLDELTVVPR